MFKHLTLTCVAIGTLSIQHAGASEATKDISKQINGLRPSITSIELYTVPTTISLRRLQTEAGVVEGGCHYSAVEAKDVATLLDVLVDAKLTEYPKEQYGYTAHTVFHLQLRNGERITITLSPEYINGPARGDFNQLTPVITKLGFDQALTNWKARHQPVNATYTTCNEQAVIID
jgi:hypothetical protein